MNTATYEPRGNVKIAVDAMREFPGREFTARDLSNVMFCGQGQVGTFLAAAIRLGAVTRRAEGGNVWYRVDAPEVVPAPAPVTVPKFAAWTPPKMSCARTTAGRLVDTVAAVAPAPAPPAPPEPAPVFTETGIVGEVDVEPEPEEEEAEPVEFDAFLSARTGELQLIGAVIDEDGRVWLKREQVVLVKKLLDWVPE